ncbi:Sec-independent protein translocase protein TatB [Oceanobacter mangrovi]|uniref:Sec-independent protein translocase protein TatB n=1 Tax=Oceanobacter mangrovi TaxID=2862510 RepID=UPI001C8D82A1|nr:Sec-independent protein translocase protein TatB [Oceanobacter mangrovi]
MFDIGFLELVVVGVLGLLVLGPERLPKAARTVGLMIGRVRRTINGFQDELERQVRAEELKEKLKDPYATFLDDDVRKPAAVLEAERQAHAAPDVLPGQAEQPSEPSIVADIDPQHQQNSIAAPMPAPADQDTHKPS